jgi:RNA polymerase sigma-B factor
MPSKARAAARSRPSPPQAASGKESAESLLLEMIRLPHDDPRRTRIRTRLVELHIPVARYIARQYAHTSEPFEDIQQAALLGLVKAINRYDPHVGTEFRAYAFPVMAGEVKRHFRDKTWPLHVPRRIQELRLVLRQASRDFTHSHGRAPTVAEIAALLNTTEEETIQVMVAAEAYRPASLDAPIADEDGEPLGRCIGGTDPELEQIADCQALWPLVGELPARERQILMLRFFGNQTQSEIADQVGISQMQVSRMISCSLRWLRSELLRDSPASKPR